jgi:hypothetical protein
MGGPEGARVTEVQKPRGRWRKTSAIHAGVKSYRREFGDAARSGLYCWVRKGVWKRRLGWAALAVFALFLILALTCRFWFLPAMRLVLATGGVHIEKISSTTNGVWRIEGIAAKRNSLELRAASITTFNPRAWKRALQTDGTNAPIFFRIDRWRLILPQSHTAETNSFVARLRNFEAQAQRLKQKCPRAQFLNGVIVSAGGGEFRSSVIEWKNGELTGDMTWPGLNDPADFHLKLMETNKFQLILKQYALDLASKVTAQMSGDEARLTGYARWKENRANFDLRFGATNNVPIGGFLKSDGLQLPRELVRIPGVEQLNLRGRLVITNGQFDLKIGAPASTPAAAQEGG